MIPTEPIGSIPRPLELIEDISNGDGTDSALEPLFEDAIRDTIARLEATGSPVITNGEQRKYHNFWTYCVHGLRLETPVEVRDRTLEAAVFIPIEQLGTTDDCGFSPFCDDTSTTREMAFEKIRARVEGTALAEKALGVS